MLDKFRDLFGKRKQEGSPVLEIPYIVGDFLIQKVDSNGFEAYKKEHLEDEFLNSKLMDHVWSKAEGGRYVFTRIDDLTNQQIVIFNILPCIENGNFDVREKTKDLPKLERSYVELLAETLSLYHKIDPEFSLGVIQGFYKNSRGYLEYETGNKFFLTGRAFRDIVRDPAAVYAAAAHEVTHMYMMQKPDLGDNSNIEVYPYFLEFMLTSRNRLPLFDKFDNKDEGVDGDGVRDWPKTKRLLNRAAMERFGQSRQFDSNGEMYDFYQSIPLEDRLKLVSDVWKQLVEKGVETDNIDFSLQ